MSRICFWLFSGSENASAPPQQVTFWSYSVSGLAADGLDQLVEIHRVLERFAGDAERAVGLAADVAGELDALERLHHRLGELVVAEVLDQHLDHVPDLRPCPCIADRLPSAPRWCRRAAARCRRAFPSISRALSQHAAQVATMSCPGRCFSASAKLRAFITWRGSSPRAGVADRGAAAVPVRDLRQLDVERLAHRVRPRSGSSTPRPCSCDEQPG